MRLAPNYNLQNPNVCTICEEKPNGDEVIDCERYTPNSPRYRLNGRKYVCQNCAHEIAKRIGYVSNSEIEEVQGLLALSLTELSDAKKVNAAQSTLLEAVYGPKLPETIKPVAVRTIEGEVLPGTETPPVRKAGRPRKVVETPDVEVSE